MKSCRKNHGEFEDRLRECPICHRIRNAEYRKNNSEKQRLASLKCYYNNKEKYIMYASKWQKNNKEKVKITKDKYRANLSSREKEKISSRNWKKNNKQSVIEYNKMWTKNNTGKKLAINAKYRSRKLHATPKWLTSEHISQIEEFYALAQELAWLNQDGKPFHVDHIVPLQGKNVCGLHVPWNLQLLPGKINISKGNR